MLLLRKIPTLKITFHVPHAYITNDADNIKTLTNSIYIPKIKNKKIFFRTVSSVCVFTPGVGSSALGASQSTEQGHVACVVNNYVITLINSTTTRLLLSNECQKPNRQASLWFQHYRTDDLLYSLYVKLNLNFRNVSNTNTTPFWFKHSYKRVPPTFMKYKL